MTLEQKIKALIQEFRTAIYGEDVRRTYADIAELVCIEALKKVDAVVEQGNYAESQGDYAKEQGDYAKEQGDLTEEQTQAAILLITTTMQQIEAEFDDIKDLIIAADNGELLLRVEELLNDLYKIATDTDIDRIIGGTYVDEDEEGSIFESASPEDIDEIIAGTYVDTGGDEPDPDDPDEIATSEDIDTILDDLFKVA